MKRYQYNYTTRIDFSENVYRHHFLLRCSPGKYDFQKILEENITILPEGSITKGKDNFGNDVFSGYIGGFHNYFEFKVNGIIEQDFYCISEELNPVYCYPSKLTMPMKNIQNLLENTDIPVKAKIIDKVSILSHKLFASLNYESGITSIETTAEHALELGKGVCQDYSHALIALCRKVGIPARYVAGFMLGEGLTHAWIEFYDEGKWYGFDPTHDKPINSGFIKIAHGRDYTDCAIHKGVFTGMTQQNLDVFLKVEEQQ